jgi:cobyrinic acid a,c-diamide synthase
MRNDIISAAERGIPILAECGGFLYLKDSFRDKDGKAYDMAGVLPGQGFMTDKLTHFGYVSVAAAQDTPYLNKGDTVRGHEFHYCDTTDNGSVCTMSKPVGNRSWEGYQVSGNVFAGFAHLYYPSFPEFIERFLRKI